MHSWPRPYLPPALDVITHPDLTLTDSYSKKTYVVSDANISMYVCGITPYDATHLGHAATYVVFDLINRYLKASGKEVHFVENVTDIDEPLFERAKRDGIRWEDLGKSQVELFQADMTELRVFPPAPYLGVIESMPAIINAVARLVDSGKTYSLAGDIYLDLAQDPSALSKLPIDIESAIEIFSQRGGDPQREGKRHPLDPLLWSCPKNDEPSWDAPFGKGRPGWHIECVAIALNNLPNASRSSITIQGGGSDLIFPHHYMTGVQARCLTGEEFAAIYLHGGMIGLNGEKMSKSLGNLVFVSKLISEGKDPMAIRLALINRHYRNDVMWSDQLLTQAESFLRRISESLAKSDVAPTKPIIQEMVNALADDLDAPRVLRALEQWCSETESGSHGGEAGELARALDLYLGIAI